MFRLYRNVTRCYVFLADVPRPPSDANEKTNTRPWEVDFRESRWFARGWTLQELLASFVQLHFTPRDASDLVKKAHSDNNPRDNRYPPVTPELHEEIKGLKGLFPAKLCTEIAAINGWVYLTVNNGVYKTGFTTS